MANLNESERVERQMRQLSEELSRLEPDEVDADAVEARVLEMAMTWARAQLRLALKRADTTAPEVEVNGTRWGNRRVHPHDYDRADHRAHRGLAAAGAGVG